MSAQPENSPKAIEIDIRDVLAGAEAHYDEKSNFPNVGDQFDSAPSNAGVNHLLRSCEAIRIGRSGWANVIFAALTAIGGIFLTLSFFDSPDAVRRFGRPPEREFFYPRPNLEAAEQPQPASGKPASSSRAIHAGGNVAATEPNSQSNPPFTENSSKPQSPGNQPLGSPQSAERTSNRNSTGTGTAVRSRATSSRSVAARAVSSRNRQAKSARGNAAVRSKTRSANMTSRAASARGSDRLAQGQMQKSNQPSMTRSFENANETSAMIRDLEMNSLHAAREMVRRDSMRRR
jgi:hypothetical protein